jgi:hypothetical protein
MGRSTLPLLIAAVLPACATTTIEKTGSVLDTPVQITCSPESATRTLGRDWRYGCFCGIGWPDFHIHGKAESSLSPDEFAGLYQRYEALKPIDRIDAVCKRHDMCWLAHKRAESSCNVGYAKNMEDLRVEWTEKRYEATSKAASFPWRPAYESSRTEQMQLAKHFGRCAALVQDMGSAMALFDSRRSDPDEDAELRARRSLFVPPAVTLGGLLFVLGALVNDYPKPDERCN